MQSKLFSKAFPMKEYGLVANMMRGYMSEENTPSYTPVNVGHYHRKRSTTIPFVKVHPKPRDNRYTLSPIKQNDAFAS